VVLFTALIGQHFVDWTSYRETFEREATAYVGRPVTVEGKASVRLPPQLETSGESGPVK
jgi:uncharacterized protein involved in outer membrane biogenesis